MTDPDCTFCRKVASLTYLSTEDVIWLFPHSLAVLGPWQFFHGYSLLISLDHATELNRLQEEQRRAYLDEMCLLARAIEECFRPLKMNYELLGNQVPHLHWHLFPRYQKDPNRLQPVWLALDRAERDQAEKTRLQGAPEARSKTIATLKKKLEELVSL